MGNLLCIEMELTYRVILPYDPTWQALDWAKAQCSSYITNQAIPGKHKSFHSRVYDIEYIFGNEGDAIAFSLKWL